MLKCRGSVNPDDTGDNSHRLNSIRESTPLLRHSTGSNHSEDGMVQRKDYESLDYDRYFNKPYEAYMERQATEHSSNKIEVLKWAITFFIGFSTGLVAFFIDTIVKLLSKWKLDTVGHSIQSYSDGGYLILSLVIMALFNAGFVFIAACLTVYEPVAAGSGIPEIKCYLNGVKIPRVARLKSLIAKAVGVLFSVSGGLPVGKEGPMIHSGAIIGAGVPQFQSITFRKIKSKYAFFRTDRDKRDFVSSGAAAGVAAAFGAPIGGVLFSLEEGCSFWNQKLTWRTLFCSMSATFTLNFFLSGMNKNSWGYFYLPGLINFGVFSCPPDDITRGACRLWNATDLIIFVLMGFVGGLLGALFNAINKRLTIIRMKRVNTKHKAIRICEAVLVAMVTTTVAFIGSMLLGECKKNMQHNVSAGYMESDVRTYFCDATNSSLNSTEPQYYNDMATLFFNSQEEAIKQLFHQEGQFSLRTLGLFFIFFFLLACWTYGIAVPSGLFVPCLVCGAAYGRFVSTLIKNVIGFNKAIHSGTFALIGAAAFLGGVVRMTISLTVILIESTNEISYGLPLMLVLMVAKWSGDMFNEGLYDIHIHLKGVPLLEWDSPERMDRLKAKDVMSANMVFIFQRTRVAVIQRILKTTAHNAFPVVRLVDRNAPGNRNRHEDSEDDESNLDPTQLESGRSRSRMLKFEGMVLRSQLVVLLKNRIFYTDEEQFTNQPGVSYESMTADYPRYPDIVDISENRVFDSKLILDVTPYMNPSSYTIFSHAPVSQVFNLFRSMGLRHLPVVDHYGQIQGVITRHNLTHEYLTERLEEYDEMEDLHEWSAN